jgi:hypothetical protein
MTAKQSLVAGLKRLGDEEKRPSLTELELFVLDLDDILKVVTFRETIEYIIPALEIFLNEPEYLKVELISKLHHIFSKMLKSPAMVSK